MRKLLLGLILLLSTELSTIAGTPENTAVPVTTTKEASEAREAKELTLRLEEIKAMDKTELSRAERKQLRREVRDIRQRLGEIGGGVYLSVAAIIIIVLLLILLL